MTAEAKIGSAFAILFAVLLGVLGLWYRNEVQLAETSSWVRHTVAADKELSELLAGIGDLESANRGFLLDGEHLFIESAQAADRQIPGHLERVASLTAGNPRQQARLAGLRRAIEAKLAFNAKLLELRASKGADAARALFATDEGVRQMEAIRAAIREMKDEEESLLLGRTTAVRVATERGFELGVAVSLLLLGAVVAIYLRIRRDMEDRRHAGEEMRHLNRFLDAMVETIPNMIFVKDAKSLSFARLNRAGEELLGVKREALLGKSDFDLFPKEEAQFFQSEDRKTLLGRVMVDIAEEPIETPAGRRWLHTKKVPIFAEDGTPLYLLGISEDITERKKAEAEVRRAKEVAEATSRELEAFSYSVSHDLRTPLRSIDGFSQALLQDCSEKLDETGRDYLRRVRRSAQRMGELIDDLLDLSRVSRAELRRGPVDVTRLANKIAAELQRNEPKRTAQFHIADGLRTEADERLLRVVLENLLGNAWKFTSKRPGALIELKQGEQGQAGEFLVRDNGAGFDMTYAGKLFGAFQRLHNAAEFEGTGIGLATVQRIIARHGGRIWAEGKVGEGATFHFTLAEAERTL